MIFNESALHKDDISISIKNEKKAKVRDQVEFNEISNDNIVMPIDTPKLGESLGSNGNSRRGRGIWNEWE